MGGGSSRPKFVKKDVRIPRPVTPDIKTGVSISQSKGCTSGDCSKCQPNQDKNECCSPCQLIIPANVSASSARLFRTPDSKFSSNTKLIVEPSIPFEISFNGKSENVFGLTLFHPSPIRIENVQHDAMLTLGVPEFNKLIVMIPIIASPNTSDASNFIGKIMQYAAPMVQPTATVPNQVPAPVTAATGADWNLTKVIPVGQNSIASGAFYTWNSSTYQEYVVSDTPFQRTFGWKAIPGPQYVLMAEPISINPVDLELLRRMPVTPPENAIHSIGEVSYKNAPPDDCPDCKKPSLAELQQFQFQKRGSPGLSAGQVMNLLISVATILLGLYAISIGLKWALDSYKGGLFKRWSDAIANALPKQAKNIPETGVSPSAL